MPTSLVIYELKVAPHAGLDLTPRSLSLRRLQNGHALRCLLACLRSRETDDNHCSATAAARCNLSDHRAYASPARNRALGGNAPKDRRFRLVDRESAARAVPLPPAGYTRRQRAPVE